MRYDQRTLCHEKIRCATPSYRFQNKRHVRCIFRRIILSAPKPEDDRPIFRKTGRGRSRKMSSSSTIVVVQSFPRREFLSVVVARKHNPWNLSLLLLFPRKNAHHRRHQTGITCIGFFVRNYCLRSRRRYYSSMVWRRTDGWIDDILIRTDGGCERS